MSFSDEPAAASEISKIRLQKCFTALPRSAMSITDRVVLQQQWVGRGRADMCHSNARIHMWQAVKVEPTE